MFSVKGTKLRYFALALAVIAFLIGVYVTFFETAGLVKTQATIVSIEEDEVMSTVDERRYIVMVDYVADGSRYTTQLDSYSDSYKVGKTLPVYFDPQNPTDIHSGKGFGVYLMALGAAMGVASVFVGRKKDAVNAS